MGTKIFNPYFVFFAQKIEESHAIYVYLEKDENENIMLTFAMLKKDEDGIVRIADDYSVPISIEDTAKPFVTGKMDIFFTLKSDMNGALFLQQDEINGKWKLLVSTDGEFGKTITEEYSFTICLPWLPF